MGTPRPVRYRCELAAEVLTDEGHGAPARVLELSERGAFVEAVEALEPLQVGDGLTLALAIPGGEPWVARARVSRWGTARLQLSHRVAQHLTVSVPGCALEYDALPDDDLERLRDFLELLDDR